MRVPKIYTIHMIILFCLSKYSGENSNLCGTMSETETQKILLMFHDCG